MPDAKAHAGGCHCGRVRFEATTDLAQVIACNCSICRKRGFLWSFVPPERFTLHAGGDALTEYGFGRRTIHHLFCPDCGVEAFARGRTPDGKEMVAIMVSCLDNISDEERDGLKVTYVDGRNNDFQSTPAEIRHL